MSGFDASPGVLRLTGLTTLVGVLGFGMLAASIPGWRAPTMRSWTATIPRQEGARGLEANGNVLVGGFPQGRILEVDGDSGLVDDRGRTLIAIHFELPASIELGRDAVIRKSVGIAGTNGVLDIPEPGSRTSLFGPDEPRRLAIDTSPPPGGSIGVLIGRRNGERIEEIAEAGDRFGNRLPPQLRQVTAAARALLDEAKMLEEEGTAGAMNARRRVDGLVRLLADVGDRSLDLPPVLGRIREETEALARSILDEVDRWRPTVTSIMADVDAIRIESDRMVEGTSRWRPLLRSLESQLTQALEDLEATRTRLVLLAPDVSDGLARTMARMVLAGGQLSRAIEDVLPLAIEAITTRPDRRSESRRLLLESVGEAVEAGTEVRDAARRLEIMSRTADGMPFGDESYDADLAAELDRRVEDLERLLDVLGTRLREEIEADLDRRGLR